MILLIYIIDDFGLLHYRCIVYIVQFIFFGVYNQKDAFFRRFPRKKNYLLFTLPIFYFYCLNLHFSFFSKRPSLPPPVPVPP